MGANASTAVPLYASGEVLDAARLNLTNCGVPVFSGTATRDAAFGGSGEKILAEGQLCYLEDSNIVQYYDGASFATVGPTTVSSALTFITGAAFSAVSSVSAATNTFTATYTNYLIIVDISAVSTGLNVLLRWRASGTDTSSGNYFSVSASNGTPTSVSSGTSHQIQVAGNGGTYAHGFQLTAYAPQLARATVHTGQSFDGAAVTVQNFGGTINLATQFDAFTLLTSTGNMTGNYRVYGYQNS